MKPRLFNALITLALVACQQQEQTSTEKFAGFTPVGANKDNASFYLDTHTVKRRPNGDVSFNLVRVLPDGHVIQNAQSDCKTNFNTFEGVKFGNDGTSQEKFNAESQPLPNANQPETNALVTMVCATAEQNRVITGAFNDVKALEILYGTYQASTQTASWENLQPPTTLDGYEDFLGKSGIVKLMDSKEYTEQEKIKHIVLTATTVNDSTQFLLNAAVFVKTGNSWHIEAEYPYLKVAKNGEPKIMRWERIGKGKYAIVEANSNSSTSYIEQYELNEQGLTHFFMYSNDNVLEYVKHIQNNENINITFRESEKDYWDTVLTANEATGQIQEIYQFKNTGESSLSQNILKELFGVTSSDKKVKTAHNELTSFWLAQTFQNGNDDVHVVFTKTQPLNDDGTISECHACGGAMIGAVTYKKIHDKWQVASKQQKIAEEGDWGDAPAMKKAEILQLSPNNTVFLIDAKYGGMGGFSEWKDLLLFSKNNWGRIGQIYVSDSLDCDGERKCFSYKGKISLIADGKEYPDILVIKTGTEIDEKENIIPAKNAIYIFNGKEYEEKQKTPTP